MAQASNSTTQERSMANAVFNLMRRLPPNQVAKSLAGVGSLIEDEKLKQQIFDQVDQPLEVETDTATGQQFLKHEYNRDGDSYRSPYSNTYFPPSPDATFFPSEALLALEQKANALFATYVQLYYDFAISSVYFNDTDSQGFNACFLVKKELNNEKNIKKGCWDAVHIVACNLSAAPKATYRVFTTVMITVEKEDSSVGQMGITGSCSRSSSEALTIPDSATGEDLHKFHLRTIGKMIESNEGRVRDEVLDGYVNK